jgi:D-alanine-D-alanine ligase
MKKNIALLFGGVSTEHEISIKSAEFIFRTLDKQKYNIKLIYIDRDNFWNVPSQFENQYPDIKSIFQSNPQNKIASEFKKDFLLLNPINRTPENSGLKNIDIMFLGLHGGDGENGKLQAYLDFQNIPYTGSGFVASALAMDKEKSNLIFQSSGFYVAKFLNLRKSDFSNFSSEMFLLSFPVFIKPNSGGSSVGVSKVKNFTDLKNKLEKLFEVEEEILIQEFISGTEVSCGVLENANREIEKLYPTEIIPENEFFDYEAKYILGKSKEITPARINPDLTEEIRSLAEKAHRVLGCKGYSRTDFIIQGNIPYILETNTLPGMTETSLIPEQAKYSGIQMSDVFDNLISLAKK